MHFARDLQVQHERSPKSAKSQETCPLRSSSGTGTRRACHYGVMVVRLGTYRLATQSPERLMQARVALNNIWSANKHHQGYTTSHFSVDRQTVIRVEEQKGNHRGRAMVSLVGVATCTLRGSRSNRIFGVTVRRFDFVLSWSEV